MRIALTLLVVMAVLALSVEAHTTENAYLTAFTAFIAKFRKAYASTAFAKTLAVFKRNYDRIVEVNKANLGFTLGVNQFADLSNEEFMAQYTGDLDASSFIDSGADAESGAEMLADTEMSAEDAKAIFAKGFDWRSKPGVVKTPKNQGGCGSCWAFTTLSTVESAMAIKGKVQKEYLSTQLMAECACNNCGGGSYSCGFGYVKKTGFYLESQKKYTGKLAKCDTTVKVAGKISDYKHVSGKEGNYLSLVQKNPAYVALNAGALQFYKKGIITKFANCSRTANHAVTLVGFGAYKQYNYYIIKNSWGSLWGEKGFFRLQAGACEVYSRGATIPIV